MVRLPVSSSSLRKTCQVYHASVNMTPPYESPLTPPPTALPSVETRSDPFDLVSPPAAAKTTAACDWGMMSHHIIMIIYIMIYVLHVNTCSIYVNAYMHTICIYIYHIYTVYIYIYCMYIQIRLCIDNIDAHGSVYVICIYSTYYTYELHIYILLYFIFYII